MITRYDARSYAQKHNSPAGIPADSLQICSMTVKTFSSVQKEEKEGGERRKRTRVWPRQAEVSFQPWNGHHSLAVISCCSRAHSKQAQLRSLERCCGVSHAPATLTPVLSFPHSRASTTSDVRQSKQPRVLICIKWDWSSGLAVASGDSAVWSPPTEQMFKALANARAALDPKMTGIRLSVLEISAPSFL